MKLFNIGVSMKNITFMIIAMVFLMSFNMKATAAEWQFNRNIQYLYAGEVGNRYAIKLVGSQPNPDSCINSNDLVINPNNEKLKEMWALLLSAYMANKTINLYISGCSTLSNKPVVTDISLGSH